MIKRTDLLPLIKDFFQLIGPLGSGHQRKWYFPAVPLGFSTRFVRLGSYCTGTGHVFSKQAIFDPPREELNLPRRRRDFQPIGPFAVLVPPRQRPVVREGFDHLKSDRRKEWDRVQIDTKRKRERERDKRERKRRERERSTLAQSTICCYDTCVRNAGCLMFTHNARL